MNRKELKRVVEGGKEKKMERTSTDGASEKSRGTNFKQMDSWFFGGSIGVDLELRQFCRTIACLRILFE